MGDRTPSFAHIINPVAVGPESDLHVAQPITFESMRLAREFAGPACDIDFFSAHYPEDQGIAPEFFSPTAPLDRSILDLGDFAQSKKLPILKDILDRLYDSSTAEYFVYSNVDIALMPNFYVTVRELINCGYDALVINRRTIPETFSKVEELPLMYAEAGKPHCGYDCFVFRRDSYPGYCLANCCIGAASIGSALLVNLACFGSRFREFSDLHLTFHIGDRRVWTNSDATFSNTFNARQFMRIKRELAPKFDIENLPEVGQNHLKHYFAMVKQWQLEQSSRQ